MAGDGPAGHHGRTMRSLLVLALAAVLAAAELGPWTACAPMLSPRQEFPAVHADGLIYVAGGMDSSTSINALTAFDAYDLAADRWTALPRMPLGLNHPGLAALGGRIYVLGGFTLGPKASDRAFAYDIAARTWSELPRLPVKAAAPGVVVHDGKVWVFGGTAVDSWKGTGGRHVQVFDPATRAWTMVNSAMPYGKQHIGAGLVGGKVYLSPSRMPREDDTCQEYDLAADTWRVMNRMPELPRTGLVSSWPVVDGRLYYIGGETSSAATRYVHEFTPDAAGGTWRRVRDYPSGLHGVGPVSVGNRIFVFGGGTSVNVTGRTDKVFVTVVGTAPPPAAIGFQAAGVAVGEGAGQALLTVTRSGDLAGAVGVSWSCAAGSASAGSDFVAASGSLAFAAGATTALIAVPLLDDALVEGSEALQVLLASPTGGAVLGTPAATVTIADDDAAPPPASPLGTWRLVSGDQLLAVQAMGLQDGAAVQLQPGAGPASQVWTVRQGTAPDRYELINQASGKALECYAAVPSEGDAVRQWKINRKDWQQWRLTPLPGGPWRIAGVWNPGLLTADPLQAGTPAVLRSDAGGDGQAWILLPTGGG